MDIKRHFGVEEIKQSEVSISHPRRFNGYTDIENFAELIDIKKFAEIIVRECANYAFSDDQERIAMLNHFGVKE